MREGQMVINNRFCYFSSSFFFSLFWSVFPTLWHYKLLENFSFQFTYSKWIKWLFMLLPAHNVKIKSYCFVFISVLFGRVLTWYSSIIFTLGQCHWETTWRRSVTRKLKHIFQQFRPFEGQGTETSIRC